MKCLKYLNKITNPNFVCVGGRGWDKRSWHKIGNCQSCWVRCQHIRCASISFFLQDALLGMKSISLISWSLSIALFFTCTHRLLISLWHPFDTCLLQPSYNRTCRPLQEDATQSQHWHLPNHFFSRFVTTSLHKWPQSDTWISHLYFNDS
jgi:hypothetical protein